MRKFQVEDWTLAEQMLGQRWTLRLAGENGADDESITVGSLEEAAFVVAYMETAWGNGTDYATAVIVARLVGIDVDVLNAGEKGVMHAVMDEARSTETLAEAVESWKRQIA